MFLMVLTFWLKEPGLKICVNYTNPAIGSPRHI